MTEYSRVVNALGADERYELEERAAIIEYDGKLTRDEAEALALAISGKSR